MRKDRIVEREHGDYVRAERDILTSVLHPYIVTLRYSFQVYAALRYAAGGAQLVPPCSGQHNARPRLCCI